MSESEQLVECVPNISEGVDQDKLDRIVQQVSKTGVKFLHVDSGIDANRSVLTFAGSVRRVFEGVRELFRASSKELDMTAQHGAHPRLGAIDVCPFIPLKNVSFDVLNQAVCTLAEEMSEAYDLPIYLYESSARMETRKALSSIRRGGYEALRSRIQTSDWTPDFGPTLVNEKLGATVMGVRDVLVAFNVNLAEADFEQAQRIAARVRRASQYLKALAWDMPTYGCLQISMNLTRFWEFGLYEAFEVCRREALSEGVKLNGSELIGLVPLQALLDAGQKFADVDIEDTEVCVNSAIVSLGLNAVRPFDPDAQILERCLGEKDILRFPIS